MGFQLHALPYAPFAEYFDLDVDALAHRAARIETVDVHPGYPCVVSLVDADVGERIVVANHEHLAENSPYRQSHAVYVREGAVQAHPAPGEVPQMLAIRLLSVRAYDAAHLMTGADVVEGTGLAGRIETMFADEAVAYIHIHIARPGCFAARVSRASD